MDIIPQVAFAKGHILHQGTGKPPIGTVTIRAQEGPVLVRFLEDGTFVISGDLPLLMPELDVQPYVFHLTIQAVSPQFAAGSITVTQLLTITQGANFDPDQPTPPAALVDLGTILLLADPANIRGRVVKARNPADPINGASVTILSAGPPVSTTTGADGSYRLDGVVVTAPAQIECKETMNFKTQTRDLLIDYTRAVNEENFRLMPL